MSKNNIIGTYVGNISHGEGFLIDGKFYSAINQKEEVTIDKIMDCPYFTLKIQEQKCNFIWGCYEYYNPLRNGYMILKLHGVKIGKKTWQLTVDNNYRFIIITLIFDKKNNIKFTMVMKFRPISLFGFIFDPELPAVDSFFDTFKGKLVKSNMV